MKIVNIVKRINMLQRALKRTYDTNTLFSYQIEEYNEQQVKVLKKLELLCSELKPWIYASEIQIIHGNYHQMELACRYLGVWWLDIVGAISFIDDFHKEYHELRIKNILI